MEIYRFGDEPYPVLIANGKPELCPIQKSNDPVSGYALNIGSHFVELSFDEIRAIAALPVAKGGA